jgi:predicted adenine nucleotide alpha hydrolase (AANH) superfamily ATPase
MKPIPRAKADYRKMMVETLKNLEGTPSLLLHSCCAPCSTAVISALSAYFRITVFYYNPNIDERAEYEKRANEQRKLIGIMPTPNPVSFMEGEYDSENFLSGAAAFADEEEGGERCTFCYSLRLAKTASTAGEKGFDFFTTTLSISPMKDAERINVIGKAMGDKFGVKWLASDFKKQNGYQKSIELSKEYGLYRQNYCGCSYSKRDAFQE